MFGERSKPKVVVVLEYIESIRIWVELFNGAGGLAEGFIHKVDKGGSDVELLEDVRIIAPQGIQWHVFAAFGTWSF